MIWFRFSCFGIQKTNKTMNKYECFLLFYRKEKLSFNMAAVSCFPNKCFNHRFMIGTFLNVDNLAYLHFWMQSNKCDGMAFLKCSVLCVHHMKCTNIAICNSHRLYLLLLWLFLVANHDYYCLHNKIDWVDRSRCRQQRRLKILFEELKYIIFRLLPSQRPWYIFYRISI